jgi:hypothetical protein
MSNSNLTALTYNVDSIGKLFSDSKTRHTWTMDIDGETHVVVVTASWNSGKFSVELNGHERFHQVVSGVFMYSFKFRDRFFKLQQIGDQLNLLIDTVPFSQYSAKAKAEQAAMLKSYEARTKGENTGHSPPKHPTSHSPKSNKSSSPEPFSGDLAKRLGKRGDYVQQKDEEEDFFSAPVNIQSFVTATPVNEPVKEVVGFTVIPNLIEFSDAPANKPVPRVPVIATGNVVVPGQVIGSVTPATGPVTPRDQISPSKLINPFSAFDELAQPQQGSKDVSSKPLLDEGNPFR